MKKFRSILCSVFLISLVSIGVYWVFSEYRMAAAWAAGEFVMDSLANGVRRAGPLDPAKIDDLSFDALFASKLMGIYQKDRGLWNPSFGKNGGLAILYWLPNDPNREIVFITSAPMRRPFSGEWVHWAVTLKGKLATISCGEFVQIMARRNLNN